MARSTRGIVPSARVLALVNLTVQRASRSLCRILAGSVSSNLRGCAGFDRVVFLARVALARRRDQAGVDDLAGHGDIAGRPQRVIEPVEQRLDHPGPGEFFAKQPDRAGVGDTVGQTQTKKAHEGQAVVDEEFRALVREIVGRLDDQDFEHQHRIERRASALSAI